MMNTLFVLLVCVTSVLSDLFCDSLPSLEITLPASKNITPDFSDVRSRVDVGSPLILTPYIEENRLDEAREVATVDDTDLLPGINSYAGYVTVNKEYNSNTWFWYFPVEGMPVEDTPWILWLEGGPGVSSLYGLLTGTGPLYVTDDGNLDAMPYSWGRNHSLLFIDNPVGTGFSFTEDERGYAKNQETIGEDLYNALQQILTIFPELRKAPLTIVGASYAGKHIPSLGVQILWHRDEDEQINLQGLAIGNGFTDPITLQNMSSLVRDMGFVDDRIADEILKLEGEVIQLLNSKETMKALNCYIYLTKLMQSNSHLTNTYIFTEEDFTLMGPWIDYAQRDDVRRALHVGNTEFTTLGIIHEKLMPDLMNSAKMWLEELLDNYKVMLYSGHLDIVVPYRGSVNTYNSLNFTGAEDYKNSSRSPWYHNGILAGYYKTGGNLIEVMVRNAGHMVPTDQPSAALGLITAFTHQLSLEQDTGHLAETTLKPVTSSSSASSRIEL